MIIFLLAKNKYNIIFIEIFENRALINISLFTLIKIKEK